MAPRWALPLALLLVASGCSATRIVRLDTGQDSFVVTPREEDGTELEEAEIDDDEFEAAVLELAGDVRPFENPLREARALFGVPPEAGCTCTSTAPGDSFRKAPGTRRVHISWSPVRTTS